MFESFPKSGKTMKKPSKVVKPESETLGSPYYSRHSMGGSETRMNQLFLNYYGKRPRPAPTEMKGTMVSPRRTMISG